jgi:phosphoserine phosphatase RsbU/P
MDAGTFGICETCAEPIEVERMLADPLTRFCLDHLTPVEQRALQHDLDLASRIQRELLPRADARVDGWEIAYHYEPAGPVSGDYCDLIQCGAGLVYFLTGDIAGKGVAAAMLMSHLSATLRTLISVGLPLDQMMERTSRAFCESTLPTHYATLVCGRASSSGDIEICNAGHPPPLVVRAGGVVRLEATSMPIGLFCTERFSSRTVHLASSETLLLYTDGLSEAHNGAGAEYGIERLCTLAASVPHLPPKGLIDACLSDLAEFRGRSAPVDDLTIMAVRFLIRGWKSCSRHRRTFDRAPSNCCGRSFKTVGARVENTACESDLRVDESLAHDRVSASMIEIAQDAGGGWDDMPHREKKRLFDIDEISSRVSGKCISSLEAESDGSVARAAWLYHAPAAYASVDSPG